FQSDLAQRPSGFGAAHEFSCLAEHRDKILPDADPQRHLHQASQSLACGQHQIVERLIDKSSDPCLDRRRIRRVMDGDHRTLQHVRALFGEQPGELRLLARLQYQDAIALQSVSHDVAPTPIASAWLADTWSGTAYLRGRLAASSRTAAFGRTIPDSFQSRPS